MGLTDDNTRPWFKQIEDDADTYEPASYDLLTFYHMLETQGDSFSNSFIPLTAVLSTLASETKIMAVGLIPPAVRPSGRILNRSATIRSLDPDAEVQILNGTGTAGPTTVPARLLTGGAKVAAAAGALPPEFWDKFVVTCNKLGCKPEDLALVIQTESGFNPGAIATNKDSGATYGRGLIQIISSTAQGLGLTQDEFQNIPNTSAIDQLDLVEKYYGNRAANKDAVQLKAMTFGGYRNPDGSIYSSAAKSPDYKAPGKQAKDYAANAALDRYPWTDAAGNTIKAPKGFLTQDDVAFVVKNSTLNPAISKALDEAKARLNMQGGAAAPVQPDGAATKEWADNGADNAAESAKTADLRANRDPMQSELGKRFGQAQQQLAELTNAAIQKLADTKPLRMLVNPASFRVTAEPVISEGNWGRSGPIVEFWGNGQDRIEASGKIAGYYSMDSSDGSGPGLTRTARQFSQSYQNLLSLWLIYKNNAGIYIPDYLSLPAGSKNKSLSVVGSVYLYYDDILYIGSFDSFSVTEADTAPYTVEYQFSFVVRAWYLLDHPSSPQYTYGVG